MSIETRDRFKEADSSLTPWSYDEGPKPRYQGTEDWVLVEDAEQDNMSYEWDEIRVFYSPSARRYFWASDYGCSCNDWTTDIKSSASFEDGDRNAAIRAADAWREHSEYGRKDRTEPAERLKAAIRDFDSKEVIK